MKEANPSERNASEITILSVGPHEPDHARLSEIFDQAQWTLCPGTRWTLKTAPSLSSAVSALRTGRIPLVVCEDDLGTDNWQDLCEKVAAIPDAPLLIVASRRADERLWAEALNLGAYDVLAKPFDSGEVVRTLSQAWLRRMSRQPGRKHSSAAGTPAAMDLRAGLAV